MKPWIYGIAAAALALALAAVTIARMDIPNPDGSRQNRSRSSDGLLQRDAHITIKADQHTEKAILRIPRAMLESLQPQAENSGSGSSGSASQAGWTISPLQTIVSGIAMSLAIVFAGLRLSRSRRQVSGKTVAFIAAGLILLGTAAMAMANAAPPSRYQGNLRKAMPAGISDLSGPVEIQVVSDGDQTQLTFVVPADGDKER